MQVLRGLIGEQRQYSKPTRPENKCPIEGSYASSARQFNCFSKGTDVLAGQKATLGWPKLREEEVKPALFGAHPYSGPGRNGVPFVILQYLWHVLRDWLLPLFAASPWPPPSVLVR